MTVVNMLTWLRDHNEPIVTSYIFPPISIRIFDWCAYRDPEVTPYGYGRTEAEAIADLLMWEDDE